MKENKKKRNDEIKGQKKNKETLLAAIPRSVS